MKKEILFCMISIMVIGIGIISGCTTEKTDQNNNDTESKPDYDSLHEKFENAMDRVAGFFVDESGSYNFDTSQNEIDYILNYNQTEFEKHKKIILDNDDIIEELGENTYYSDSGKLFAYEYEDCRDSAIDGLEYLLLKDYNKAWSSFLSADNAITGSNSYTGDMWPIQFGFEDGICDILFDMGYWGDYFEWDD
jgi:hypothetical protein